MCKKVKLSTVKYLENSMERMPNTKYPGMAVNTTIPIPSLSGYMSITLNQKLFAKSNSWIASVHI